MEQWKIVTFYGKNREFIHSIQPYPLVAQSIRLEEGRHIGYAAFRDARTRRIFAAVVVWEKTGVTGVYRYTLEYEDTNPPHHRATKKILMMLTRTENPDALAWRKECFEQLKRRRFKSTFEMTKNTMEKK